MRCCIMKRLILITGLIIYTLFAISSFIAVASENKSSILQVTSSTETTIPAEKGLYTVKEKDGVIVVIYNEKDEIIKITDTSVAILPLQDQQALNRGIQVYNDKELNRLLEDFCS